MAQKEKVIQDWMPLGGRGVTFRKVEVDGRVATELRFFDDGDLGPSKSSGKTNGVANTGGGAMVPSPVRPQGISVSLNANFKP